MKIVSWNLNGIRAVHRNGYWETFLSKLPADIYCFQETKARPEQLDEKLRDIDGYKSYFNYPAHKKGYAGVALYLKESLKNYKIIKDFGPEDFDTQGRLLGADFGSWTLLNLYFPNGGMGPEALKYKLQFYDYFLDFVLSLKDTGKNIIITGDFNVAHEEIDLARPKENEGSVGFLPEERAWMDALLASGFADVWREINPEKQEYSWWSMRTRARERNVGWRIDYFIVSDSLLPKVKSVQMHQEIFGSDHCPLSLDIDI